MEDQAKVVEIKINYGYGGLFIGVILTLAASALVTGIHLAIAHL